MKSPHDWVIWADKLFPYLLLFAAGLGMALPLLLRRVDLFVFGLSLVVPLVIAACTILKNRNSKARTPIFAAHFSCISFANAFLLSCLLFIISMVVLASFPTRPLIYHFAVSLCSGAVALQVFLKRPTWTDKLILGEIVLISLNLIWGVTLKYPLYFGDTDTLVHLHLIDEMLSSGRIALDNVDYMHYPLYHASVAAGVEVTGLATTTALFLMMGLIWQIGTFFAFLISRQLSNSTKTALLVCLLFATSSQVIFYGTYAIARSLAFVLMMCWLYLIFGKAHKDARYLSVSLVIMSAMILTHHLNVLLLVPVLLIAYACQTLTSRFRSGKLVYEPFVYLLTLSSLAYMILIASNMSGPQLGATIRAMLTERVALNANPAESLGFGVMLGTVYYSLVLFLGVVGAESVLNNFRAKRAITMNGLFSVVGFCSLLLYVPGPLDLLPLSGILLTWRFALIVSPFIVVLIVSGIRYLDGPTDILRLNISQTPSLAVVTLACVSALVFFSSISTGNAQDNDSLPHTSAIDTPYFTNSELASFRFLSAKGNNAQPLYSDYQSYRNEFSLPNFGAKYILSGGNLDYVRSGYLLFRIGELERKGALTFSSSQNEKDSFRYRLDPSHPESDIETNLLGRNLVYGDGYSQVFFMQIGTRE